MTDGEDVLDSVFHWAALRAYLEVYAATKQYPPDSELSHPDYDSSDLLVSGAGITYRRSNGLAQPGTVVPATAYYSSRRTDMSNTQRSPSSPPYRRL
jgi:hypothetical protein